MRPERNKGGPGALQAKMYLIIYYCSMHDDVAKMTHYRIAGEQRCASIKSASLDASSVSRSKELSALTCQLRVKVPRSLSLSHTHSHSHSLTCQLRVKVP